MIAIAWAIIFLAICISDSAYTLKFGIDHFGSGTSKTMSMMAVISFGFCILFSLIGAIAK